MDRTIRHNPVMINLWGKETQVICSKLLQIKIQRKQKQIQSMLRNFKAQFIILNHHQQLSKPVLQKLHQLKDSTQMSHHQLEQDHFKK